MGYDKHELGLDELASVSRVARAEGVAPVEVRKAIKGNECPGFRLGKRNIRTTRADVRRWIRSKRVIRLPVSDSVEARVEATLRNQRRRGAERATVAVFLSGENGRVHLDVIDSGPGVPRRDARTIFKPFRRGRGADAAAKGGIGLGLALARSWAGLMGGRLDLVARHHPEHGGAHFRLTIPARLPS